MVQILKDHRPTDVIFQDLQILKFGDLVKLKTCEVMYKKNMRSDVQNTAC